MVGFGSYHLRFGSGREGDACLVVNVPAESREQQKMLAKLGKQKMGKLCLYFKRPGDPDTAVLDEPVAAPVAEVKRRYG